MRRSKTRLFSFMCLAGLTLVGFVWCPVILGDQRKASQDMVLIEGGTFVMGDVFKDGRRFILDEKPLHEVALDDYYVSKYETTVADFRAFVQETRYQTIKELELAATLKKNEKPYDTYTWEEGKFAQEDRHPVVLVAWEDAESLLPRRRPHDPGWLLLQ